MSSQIEKIKRSKATKTEIINIGSSFNVYSNRNKSILRQCLESGIVLHRLRDIDFF